MAKPVLNALTRKTKGKGTARRLRRDQQIPASFYGPNTQPVMLAVSYAELERLMRRSAAENIILDLNIQSDDGSETRSVILKELQVDPAKDIYLHVDFCEISMDKEITVHIPISLKGTPAGVKEGGVLQHIRRELNVSCLPDKLIDTLELDVSGLEIGEALHIRDINLPEGITTLEEGDLTVASVAAPTAEMEGAPAVKVEGVEGAEEAPEAQAADTEEKSYDQEAASED
ncbi:MAG: 50S ribosomal protein L25 [Deltaproteobacteria bacterium]|nr:50S ribosomal protein L25 [Deltaproteobacteria bacterium]